MQHHLSVLIIAAGCFIAGGCSTTESRLRERSATTASLDPETRSKVERGVIERGYTAELVYLALGKPSKPANVQIDATREGTWTYHSARGNERDYVRAGFRRRVVFDPVRKSDVIITEPVDPRMYPNLQEYSLYVTFRDGRVVDVQRTAL